MTAPPTPLRGVFIAFEGGDGAGKSTQARLLGDWLTTQGYAVTLTREPGGTEVGARIREILLSSSSSAGSSSAGSSSAGSSSAGSSSGSSSASGSGRTPSAGICAKAEALLFAADRAQHVETLVRPALERGEVVVTDRYVDSSIAYQSAGREMDADQIGKLSGWATSWLRPALTVVLDVTPELGRSRRAAAPDRLESEPDTFHDAVRQRFLDLAAQHEPAYLVVDAGDDPDVIAARVRERVLAILTASTASPAVASS